MIVRTFSTIRRRVGHCCWTLLAFTLVAAPGLTWADDCNDSGSIKKTPGSPYLLKDVVNVRYTFGSEGDTTAGLKLTVDNSEVYVALDCVTSAGGGDREDCLGFNGAAAAAAANDGTAIAYAGNLTFGNAGRCNANIFATCTQDSDCAAADTCGNFGDACTGLTFAATSHGTGDPVEETPNVVVLQANAPIQLDPGESCFIAFDAYVNNIGEAANWETGDQFVNAAAGFTGQCTAELGADSTKSTNYQIDITPDIDIRKEVSIDGGANWYDANSNTPPDMIPVGIVPGTGAIYRLIVENIGEEALKNVVLTDNTAPFFLGLDKVALPARCYDATSGFFEPGDTCTITSGDSGFEPLGTSPNSEVAVCATKGTKTNLSCVDGEGAATGGAVNACDPATVECLEPGIDVTKTGATEAKVGDAIKYTICAENTGSTDLANCKLEDALLVPPASADFATLIKPGSANKVCNDYDYTVAAGDVVPGTPPQVKNTAKVTCDVVGGSGATVNDVDNWDVDIFEVSGVLTKDCQPDTVITVPGKIDWDICIENTGDKDMTCDVTDSKAFTGTKSLGPIAPGAANKQCLPDDLSRATTSADVGTVTNTANATCTVSRTGGAVDNKFDLKPATDTCEVDQEVVLICRTPGFWGTHAGTEKGDRSFNLAQEVIDYAPGATLGTICGVDITSTDVYGPDGYGSNWKESATEAICVHPKTKIVRQLMRQMTAAALNCVMSGAAPNCAGTTIGQEWTGADDACKAADDPALMSDYIEKFDDFNNGIYPGSECVEELRDSPVWDDGSGGLVHKLPGPAGSSQGCNTAIQNRWFLVPENKLY